MPDQVHHINIGLVFPNPEQPRKTFEPAALSELATSIKSTGLLQPISVQPKPDGRYMIIAGERRWRAHQIAGLPTIRAIVEDVTPERLADLALIENLVRQDLNPIEEARAYQARIAEGATVERLAAITGKSVSVIQSRLALLKLHPDFQEGVRTGAIDLTRARAMSRLSIEGQYRLWAAISDGKCKTPDLLNRVASVIWNQENQADLFGAEPCSAVTRKASERVAEFVKRAGALLGSLSAEELAALETGPALPEATIYIDQLHLLVKECYRVLNPLLNNQARAKVNNASV